jgi:hypothetical protein
MAGFVWDSSTAAVLLVAVATLGLAAFLLVVDFSSRIHRALALFLFLRALLDGSLAFTAAPDDLGYRLRVYLFLAVPFAAVNFTLVYRRRHQARHRRQPGRAVDAARATLLVVTLILWLAYAFDHGLFGVTVDGVVAPGPLAVATFLPYPAYAAIAFVLARDGRAETGREHRRALVAAAVGFGLQPLFYAVFRLADLGGDLTANRTADLFPAAFQVIETAAFVLTLGLLLATAIAMRGTLVRPDNTHMRIPLAILGLAAVLSGLGMAVAFAVAGTPPPIVGFRSALAIWSLFLPILVSYAVLRYRLFDVDVKIRFAIRGTTLAGIFLAVFFVVNKVTENVVASRFRDGNIGIYVGGVVAGLLLFALAPLQRIADRIAARAVPANGAAHTTAEERQQLYREQLEIAWADGRLTPKERLLFLRLQERLGIAAADAARLENDVVARLQPSRPASA